MIHHNSTEFSTGFVGLENVFLSTFGQCFKFLLWDLGRNAHIPACQEHTKLWLEGSQHLYFVRICSPAITSSWYHTDFLPNVCGTMHSLRILSLGPYRVCSVCPRQPELSVLPQSSVPRCIHGSGESPCRQSPELGTGRLSHRAKEVFNMQVHCPEGTEDDS